MSDQTRMKIYRIAVNRFFLTPYYNGLNGLNQSIEADQNVRIVIHLFIVNYPLQQNMYTTKGPIVVVLPFDIIFVDFCCILIHQHRRVLVTTIFYFQQF